MIKEKLVVIKASGRNINFIRKMSKDVKLGDEVIIDTSLLWRNSHTIITAVCDICDKERKITFQEYSDYIEKSKFYYCKSCFNKNIMPQKMMDKYGVDNFTKTSEYKILSESTSLLRYGVKNAAKLLQTKEKIKETNLLRYGVEFTSQSAEMREKFDQTLSTRTESESIKINIKRKNTRVDRKLQISDDIKSDFEIYKSICRSYTKINKKELMSSWDGTDYYDCEYIKDNFNTPHTNRLYPTIDHKISIYYGFMNNIIPTIIGGIDNLCITKRGNNSSKGSKTEHNYIIYQKL